MDNHKKKPSSSLGSEDLMQELIQQALENVEKRERAKKSSSSDEIPIEFIGLEDSSVAQPTNTEPEHDFLEQELAREQELLREQQMALVETQQAVQEVQKELGDILEQRDQLVKQLQQAQHHNQLLEKRLTHTEEALRKAEQDHQHTEKEKQQIYERLLRLSADFDNLKKRSTRDREEMKMYGHEGVMRDLIGIIDNFDRAMQSMKDAPESLRAGIEMVYRSFLDNLTKHGVMRFTSQGEPFDYALHEALTIIESSEVPSNTVLQEFEAGYKFHDRLLRPARVAVSKAPPPPKPVITEDPVDSSQPQHESEVKQESFSAEKGTSSTTPDSSMAADDPVKSSSGGVEQQTTLPETPTVGPDLAANLASEITVEFSDSASSFSDAPSSTNPK